MEVLYGLGMVLAIMVTLGIGFAFFIRIVKWADRQ